MIKGDAAVPVEQHLHQSASPGRLHVDGLEVEARLTPRPGRIGGALALALRATGLRSEQVGGYLAPLGVEAVLEDGQLSLDLAADVELGADGLTASLELSDLSFGEGRVELLGAQGAQDLARAHVHQDAALAAGAGDLELFGFHGPASLRDSRGQFVSAVYASASSGPTISRRSD